MSLAELPGAYTEELPQRALSPLKLVESQATEVDPEPPRTVGLDVFKINGNVLDTDSQIPEGAVVTAINPSKKHWWSRTEEPQVLERPEGKNEFLVKDVVATGAEGFRIEKQDEGGRVIDVRVARVIRPGLDKVSQLATGDKEMFVYPSSIEARAVPHLSERRRGRHSKPTLLFKA